MAGNREGGLKAKAANLKYNPNYYKEMGSKGGSANTDKPKGFAYAAANGLDWHKEAGQRGGSVGRRRKNANNS